MGWYSEISKDISNIPDAVEYFELQLVEARQEVKLTGNVEKAAASMPGVVEHRFSQLQEIEAILEYLNIELRRLKSQHFRKYLDRSSLWELNLRTKRIQISRKTVNIEAVFSTIIEKRLISNFESINIKFPFLRIRYLQKYHFLILLNVP